LIHSFLPPHRALGLVGRLSAHVDSLFESTFLLSDPAPCLPFASKAFLIFFWDLVLFAWPRTWRVFLFANRFFLPQISSLFFFLPFRICLIGTPGPRPSILFSGRFFFLDRPPSCTLCSSFVLFRCSPHLFFSLSAFPLTSFTVPLPTRSWLVLSYIVYTDSLVPLPIKSLVAR